MIGVDVNAINITETENTQLLKKIEYHLVPAVGNKVLPPYEAPENAHNDNFLSR
jgi:hypothetical protein